MCSGLQNAFLHFCVDLYRGTIKRLAKWPDIMSKIILIGQQLRELLRPKEILLVDLTTEALLMLSLITLKVSQLMAFLPFTNLLNGSR